MAVSVCSAGRTERREYLLSKYRRLRWDAATDLMSGASRGPRLLSAKRDTNSRIRKKDNNRVEESSRPDQGGQATSTPSHAAAAHSHDGDVNEMDTLYRRLCVTDTHTYIYTHTHMYMGIPRGWHGGGRGGVDRDEGPSGV